MASPEPRDTLPADILDALQRDLGLSSASEAAALVAGESEGSAVVEGLEQSLGDSFAGAWIDGDDAQPTVAITDRSEAPQVRAAGAEPMMVQRSKLELDRTQSALDEREEAAPDHVHGWYVDVATNQVVLEADARGFFAAHRFIASEGLDPNAIRVEVVTDAPRLLQYDVRGGDAYYTPQYRCSIGFSVVGGYTTVGHCGSVGTSTRGYNQVAQGTFRGSRFPGSDEAWVAVNQNWTPRPVVNNYQGGTVAVHGNTEAAIGASTCRSGSTTGWRCGTIQAKNQTVRYPQGTVTGLTRTSACAEGGDSGGSFISGNQAQGMTSGGSGNCSTGGTTFYQPLNPTLQRYNLQLVTTGGQPPDPPDPPDPPPPDDECSDFPHTRQGTLSNRDVHVQPDGRYYYSQDSGVHRGCLDGPNQGDFYLYLQRWNGSRWVYVASSTDSGTHQTIAYPGTPGYYRYLVWAFNGSGSYTLGFTRTAN